MINTILYTGLKKNAPSIAALRLSKYNTELQELRKAYPSASEEEKQYYKERAKDLKKIIKILKT